MEVNANSQIHNINVDLIIPNRFQPRLTFDENALNELADSIKEHGIIQPLVLRKLNDKYEIIAGERRYKASILAGLSEVPAIIINLNDNQSAEVALVENIQRKNLSSIEVAKAYKNLLDKGLLTQDALSKKMGTSQSSIANKLRLLNLTTEVQDALIKEKISERHARSLLQVSDPFRQIQLLNKIISERLTVRQLDELIKNGLDGQEKTLVEEKLNTNEPLLEASNTTIEESSEILDTLVDDNATSNVSNDKVDNLLDIESLDLNVEATNIFDEGEKIEENKSYNIFNVPSYPSLEDEITNLTIDDDEIFNPFKILEPSEEITNVPEEDIKEEAKEVTIKDRILPDNIDSIKISINNLKEEIEKAGYKIQLEDFDFEDLYQIIIKIDKQA